jgi:hypothetical protein
VQGLNRQLIDILRDRRDVYVRLMAAQIADEAGGEGGAEIEQVAGQMADGLVALFVEGLEGQGTEVRTFYLATLIPSILERGGAPEDVLGSAVRYIMLMVHDVVEQLPAGGRDAAMQWFAKFSGRYMAELASVAVGAKAPCP